MFCCLNQKSSVVRTNRSSVGLGAENTKSSAFKNKTLLVWPEWNLFVWTFTTSTYLLIFAEWRNSQVSHFFNGFAASSMCTGVFLLPAVKRLWALQKGSLMTGLGMPKKNNVEVDLLDGMNWEAGYRPEERTTLLVLNQMWAMQWWGLDLETEAGKRAGGPTAMYAANHGRRTVIRTAAAPLEPNPKHKHCVAWSGMVL